MPAWGWIVLCIGAFCFGWTLGADWLERKPRGRRRRLRSIHGNGRDYYIDPKHGDDTTGDGSKKKPFRTHHRLAKEFTFK